MLERLDGSWQALLQIIKHFNAYTCWRITWKMPNFSYLLCLRDHASQEIHYTISAGLLGGVTLRVVLLSTKFFIDLLPDSTRLFHFFSFSSS